MRVFNRSERIERRVGSTVHPFFFSILFILGLPTLYAQNPASASLNAYEHVLELDYEAGSILRSTENEAFSYYVANLSDAIQLFITEDPILYETYEQKLEERLDAVQALDEVDPFRLFVLGELRLQTSFLNAKFGEEISSVWNLRKAYLLLNENRVKFPEFDYTYKSLGVLHVLLGTVPEKYNWILSLLNMKGTVNQGLSELESLMDRDHVLDFEVRIIHSLLLRYIFDEGHRSLDNLRELHTGNPDNLMVSYILASVLLKSSNAAEANKILMTVSKEEIREHEFYLFHYLLGETFLLEGNYEEALKYFKKFLLTFRGQNFIKDVNYKIFLCYHLLHMNEAEEYFNLAQIQGNTIIESDKFAAKMVSQKEYPNPVLMKIRLATDGGYYETAQRIIDNSNPNDFPSKHDRVELVYRKARLLHKSGFVGESLLYYEKTIKENQEGWYFGANSALQLGYIYWERKELEKAYGYFEAAIQYKNHEYKNSIDSKAIAAMKKIEKEL